MTRILVLNGPNLSRLGTREPDVYGLTTWPELAEALSKAAAKGETIEVRQTDDESELIGWLHEAVDTSSEIVLNPAAFTHYSYAVRDAVALVTLRSASETLTVCSMSAPFTTSTATAPF